ncbi:nucleotidyl transferase AbiEii/AbiGii toxin family protein [Streptomyces sp. NBC_01304]|uniref:nucleotidyl transferase AbiEii/AbiGii toxin family protein n=1 Tax=Streptomyces sp. NBC_01304 TaxID=2903818 RepID=UPI002E148138|nr:nucleotidyl transferase AbiEii/AbiGii toxin family protein [Streptomyces sp. NBC_01304]
MRMPELHRRLLADAFEVGGVFGLALMGGYAVQAHGVVSRPSQDLDFATQDPAPIEDIVEVLTAGLGKRGWRISNVSVTPRLARLLATDPVTEASCEVDLLKEVLWRPPVVMDVGPVIDIADVVATKMRALGDRGLPRDAIDVHAMSADHPMAELERLGARNAEDFDLRELRDRLEALVWVSDEEFAAYGLTDEQIAEIRHWAQDWERDLGLRLAEDYDD